MFDYRTLNKSFKNLQKMLFTYNVLWLALKLVLSDFSKCIIYKDDPTCPVASFANNQGL